MEFLRLVGDDTMQRLIGWTVTPDWVRSWRRSGPEEMTEFSLQLQLEIEIVGL